MGSFSQSAIQQVAESKIQAAMCEGDFENLEGFGKPFEFDDTQYDPNWWIRRKMERERLQMAANGAIRMVNSSS